MAGSLARWAPHTLPPVRPVVVDLVVHRMEHCDVVTLGWPMKVWRFRVIDALHPQFEWRTVAIASCTSDLVEEDVGMYHFME
jgi:hypothetical protein